MRQETINLLITLARQIEPDFDIGDYDVQEHVGSNVDDAFNAGQEIGEAMVARKVLMCLGINDYD